MSEPATKSRVYIFDSSVFITLNRINNDAIQLPEEVWTRLEELMDGGTIISQRYVYDEVVTNSKRPDKVSVWLMPKKSCFPKENPQQVAYMAEIVQAYPKLVDVENEKEQADPWLVALGRDMNVTDPEKTYVVVTQENQDKTTNLPAACKQYGVETISLKQFFNEVGISFAISAMQQPTPTPVPLPA